MPSTVHQIAAKATAAAEKVKMTDFDYRDKLQTSHTVQEKYLKESMPKALDVGPSLPFLNTITVTKPKEAKRNKRTN